MEGQNMKESIGEIIESTKELFKSKGWGEIRRKSMRLVVPGLP